MVYGYKVRLEEQLADMAGASVPHTLAEGLDFTLRWQLLEDVLNTSFIVIFTIIEVDANFKWA